MLASKIISRAFSIFSGVFLGAVVLLLFVHLYAKALGTNLISNSSVETSTNTTIPLDWMTDSWGRNTATFSYQTNGQDGSKSLSVKVASYRSGDAKWYFKPVVVVPGASYTFTDYYKSTVTSKLVGMTIDAQGAEDYFDIGTLAASTTWKKASFTFKMPATAKTFSVLHLIQLNGTLQTDNFTLDQYVVPTPTQVVTPTPTKTPTPTPTPTSVPSPTVTPSPTVLPSPTITVTPTPVVSGNVPNNSVEQAGSTDAPLSWFKGQWGENASTFSYLSTGHSGSKSVKTEITSYISGDAKWYYEPQSVTPGQTLEFNDWYQSNIISRVVVMFNNIDQSQTYVELKQAPVAASWAGYSDSFIVPETAESATVFHLISGVGFLITDDYSIGENISQGFTRPIVTLTFDDGLLSQYQNAQPLLQSYNFMSTFYIITGMLNTDGYMTDQMVQSLKDTGNEIANHTVDHPHLPTLTAEQLDSEFSASQAYLQTHFGVSANNLAFPYGESSDLVVAEGSKYFRSQRGVYNEYNYKNSTNLNDLRVQNVLVTTTVEEVQGWLDYAKSTNTWLILVFHGIDGTGDLYGTTPEKFAVQLEAIANSGVAVLTLNQALDEIVPQLSN